MSGLARAAGARTEAPVTVFAAASTAGALEAAARDFMNRGGGPVRNVFAASSVLARQIAQGAPADIYLSANLAWMDELERGGWIEVGSRVALLGNRLVLIAPLDRAFEISLEPGFALAKALNRGRLVIGDPGHVPAGIYAKTALENLGVWESLVPKLAFAGDVRAALVLVERGEAAAGIVYASDAQASDRVRVIGRFPARFHAPIVYSLAIVRGRSGAPVSAFHRYLSGPVAGAIFRDQGFIPTAVGS